MKSIDQNNYNKTVKLFMDSVKKTVVKFDMLAEYDKVLVGVSGGPDSVALLQFLLRIKKEYSLDIGIAHLNHLLRGKEADRDEVFVCNLAESLDIKCIVGKKDVALYAKENKLSIEDSARKVRYSFLKDTLKENKYTKIALGHNSDDNAELILMNILRGSGPKGVAGIPPKREKFIVRPFIEIPKREIYQFLESINQNYVIDSSNMDNIHLRNSVRNRLIPLIEKEYNPKVKESLIRLASIIKNEDEWMEEETESVFGKSLKSMSPDNLKADTIELSIDNIINYHSALRKRIIRKAIKKINGSLKKISSKHVDDTMKLIMSRTSGESIDLPDRIRVFKQSKSLFIKKESVPLRELGEKRKNQRNI